MIRPHRLVVLIGSAWVLAGCVYQHTVEPLSLDYRSTPAAIDTAKGDTKKITYYVDVQWDVNGIGAIAKKNGIDEVYYADLETLSILGYWTQEKVHIYGKVDRATTAADVD